MAYLLDANVFIQAKRLHYAMDFCPAFWDWIVRENGAGRVYSIDKVGDELVHGSDALSQWAKNLGRGFFLPLDQVVVDAMPKVGAWVKGRPYRQAAVNAFLQEADYYLIAYALAHKHDLVTHEVPGDGVKQVKIPEVCIGLGIRSLSPFQMLRREQARFILGPPPAQ